MKKLENLIKRYYTKDIENTPIKDVYSLFNWKKVDVVIKDNKGNVKFEILGAEFPEHYSQNACDIIASKYFRLAGVGSEDGKETSMKQIAHRMVYFWTEALFAEGLLTEKNKQIYYDEVAYMLLNQMWAPNSPQWFNTGLKHAYNIDRKVEGYFYFDEEQNKVVPAQDAYSRTAGSACFILDIEDSLLGKNSISDALVTETRLFKFGSGTGSNYYKLRGKGEKLSGGGRSSGLLSFLKVLDANAGAIKSGGTTRRAAKINTLFPDHPEIMDYIQWKMKEEQKVRALVKMGYTVDEAYDTVSGQNANNSVRLTNKLMKKMLGEDPDSAWEIKGRIDQTINTAIDAKEIWDAFNKAAWDCGDPAPQYHDTINAWHTCPAGEDGLAWEIYNTILASNPCSEYHFLTNTACNLASLRVDKFYNYETNEFDMVGYIHALTLVQMVLEATIFWGQYPTEEIARRSHLFRTTGIGLANTGYLNMIMGHAYDSEEARAIVATLSGIMTGQAYVTSALMAEEVGAFDKYELNKEHMLRVMRNHARVAGAIDGEYEGLEYKPLELDHELLIKNGFKNLSQTVREVWNNVLDYGYSFGFRNAQTSVIAPTGTIAFAMDCPTTSIEPFFGHKVFKKLVGGGIIEIINPAVPLALRRKGYNETQIETIVEYMKKENTIEGAPYVTEEHLAIFDTANKNGKGTRYISHMGHILMVAAITPLISGAISKTVNLPKEATEDNMKKVHEISWRLGVKAISIYRDGSKAGQPLNMSLDEALDNIEELSNLKHYELVDMVKTLKHKIEHPERVKPHGVLPSRFHTAKIDGIKIFCTITFDKKGDMNQIFIEADKTGSTIGGLLDSISILASNMLQYKISPQEVAKNLRNMKFEPHGFVSDHDNIKFADSLPDLIAKFIEIELGDFSGCQVKPEEGTFLTVKQEREILEQAKLGIVPAKSEITITSEVVDNHNSHSDLEGKQKVYGKKCGSCGHSPLVKNGTCHVCPNCGTTTGCS